MAEELPEPKSRKESYLAKAAGMEVEIPAPESREEQYLNAIAEGGGGGGTSDFEALSNRPKYNSETMTGSTNIPLVPSIIDNLTSTSTTDGLSANQGKVLKGTIDGLVIKDAGAPTSSTVGTVGKLYEDTTNGKLYICTAVTPGTDPDPDTYTWTEVGAGGASGATLLTTADYNYPADNPTMVDPRLLPIGLYYFASDVSILNKSSVSPYSLSVAHWMYVTDRYTYNNTEWTDWFIGPSSRNSSDSGFIAMTCETGGTFNWYPYYKADVIEGLIFADSGTKSNSARTKIRIGSGSSASNYGVAVGSNAQTTAGSYGTAIGTNAKANSTGAIAIGGYSSSTNNTRASGSNSIAIGVDTRTEAQDGISIGNHNRSSSSYATAIGNNIQSIEAYGVALGDYCAAAGNAATALGFSAAAEAEGSVALGAYSTAASVGEVNIGSSATSHGYNSSTYRLLTGLYDGQSAHDAATKGQLDSVAIKNAGAPTTATEGTVGQLLEDTTNGKLYVCTAITPGTDPDPDTYSWSEVLTGQPVVSNSEVAISTSAGTNTSGSGTITCHLSTFNGGLKILSFVPSSTSVTPSTAGVTSQLFLDLTNAGFTTIFGCSLNVLQSGNTNAHTGYVKVNSSTQIEAYLDAASVTASGSIYVGGIIMGV